MSLVIFAAAISLAAQKPLPNARFFPDVPDNHYVYALLLDLKFGGLLPELELSSGSRPFTRGQIGGFIVEAAINLERHVDDHRRVEQSGGQVRYSDVLSDLSGDQLKFQFSLVPRIRKVAKTFSANLPTFVQWKDLDRSLDDEGKLIDGLTAGS